MAVGTTWSRGGWGEKKVKEGFYLTDTRIQNMVSKVSGQKEEKARRWLPPPNANKRTPRMALGRFVGERQKPCFTYVTLLALMPSCRNCDGWNESCGLRKPECGRLDRTNKQTRETGILLVERCLSFIDVPEEVVHVCVRKGHAYHVKPAV